jgi:phosphoenolpyruvate-protein phosphotransferase (PTS system enzyme I)
MGPLVVISNNIGSRTSSGIDTVELHDLQAAIAAAVEELTALIARLNGEGGDILAFQVAMLEDDTLKDAAFAAITVGAAADEAWQQIVDAELSGYENSDDEYFRGRAADIRDLRDRVLRHLIGNGDRGCAVAGAILAGEDIAPTQFLETDWSKGGGLLLTVGSAASHVAMLARSRGVPMVVGLGGVKLEEHAEAIIDGETGVAVLSPGDRQRTRYAAKKSQFDLRRIREAEFLYKPAVTADGVPIEVLVNVARVEDIDHIDISSCNGIGLMRTEFLFRDGEPLPDEQAQYNAYRRFLEWAGDKPVTIRTLDVGGDKPIGGLTPQGERNPFLGLRGVRLTLARRDVYRTQLRALARAAVHGRLKIMVPMVTVPDELSQSAKLLDDVVGELRAQGIACVRPPLGMMVEVPAVAIVPELFADAAFFSIGSNDLTQYVTASSRDEAAVASLHDPGHPAVLRLIGAVARFGGEREIPVSLCGDMAGDPRYLESLLRAGLRSLSVAPPFIGRVKEALSSISLGTP